MGYFVAISHPYAGFLNANHESIAHYDDNLGVNVQLATGSVGI